MRCLTTTGCYIRNYFLFAVVILAVLAGGYEARKNRIAAARHANLAIVLPNVTYNHTTTVSDIKFTRKTISKSCLDYAYIMCYNSLTALQQVVTLIIINKECLAAVLLLVHTQIVAEFQHYKIAGYVLFQENATTTSTIDLLVQQTTTASSQPLNLTTTQANARETSTTTVTHHGSRPVTTTSTHNSSTTPLPAQHTSPTHSTDGPIKTDEEHKSSISPPSTHGPTSGHVQTVSHQSNKPGPHTHTASASSQSSQSSHTTHDNSVSTSQSTYEPYSWWKVVVALVIFCTMAGIILWLLKIAEHCKKGKGKCEDQSDIEENSDTLSEKISTSRV